MTAFKNCYRVLGLADFAEADVVKATFRQLARQHHPDLNPGDPGAEDRFKEINAAYEMLNNPTKRDWHDRCLRATQARPSGKNAKKPPPNAEGPIKTANAGPKPAAKKPATDTHKTNEAQDKGSANSHHANTFGDLFEGFLKKGFPGDKEPTRESPRDGHQRDQTHGNTESGSSFKEARAQQARENEQPADTGANESDTQDEGFFTRMGTKPSSGHSTDSKREPVRRGEDVTIKTVISPQEALEGLIKSVQVQHQETCRRCSGTGRVNGASCTACHGEKSQTRLRKMDVRIPAGVKTGSKVRVAREGGRGSGGGENGDLFLQIEIAYDPSLRIEKLDVHGDVSISVTEAVLGAEIDIPTLHGIVKMTIPPGTQPGRVLRLKERGVHSGTGNGDHFVTITLTVPNNLSSREKELYQELNHLRPRRNK
jgi:molecular chaperone DnaJ